MEPKEMIAVIKAHTEGKTIQARYNDREEHSDDWDAQARPSWNFAEVDFRIKPETKLRPWTYSDFPVGCWIKPKLQLLFLHFVIFVWENGVRICDSTNRGITLDFEELLSDYEHSTDAGKTWLPCGVEDSQ